MTKRNIVSLAQFRDDKRRTRNESKSNRSPAISTKNGEAEGNAFERRLNLRYKFAVGDHPVLVIDQRNFRVLDISQTGLKFVGPNLTTLHVASKVNARIRFENNNDLLVSARVIRVVGDMVALNFSTPLEERWFDGLLGIS